MDRSKIVRNSNIELLRIIAMLFIVMGHFVDQSNFNLYDESVNSMIISFLSMGACIGTNLFLIIGVWFMVDQLFMAKKVIKLYSQLLFTTVVITTAMIVVNVKTSLKDVLRGYFPFFGRALWFVSAYITLYFFSPFLRRFLEMERNKQKLFCVLSFIMVCVVSTLPDEQEGYLVNSLWFMFVFIWTGYIKHRDIIEKIQNWRVSKFIPVLGGSAYILLIIIYYMGRTHDSSITNIGLRLSYQYLMDIKTIPNFLIALSFFLWSVTGKERHNGSINKIAARSLEVYLVHQVPAFISFLWFTVFACDRFRNYDYSFIYVIFVGLAVYIGTSIIDVFREHIENKWINTKIVVSLQSKVDNFYEL